MTDEEAAAAEKAAKDAVPNNEQHQQPAHQPATDSTAAQAAPAQNRPLPEESRHTPGPTPPPADPMVHHPYGYSGQDYRQYPPQYMSQQKRFFSSCLGRAVIAAAVMGVIIVVINVFGGSSTSDYDATTHMEEKVDNSAPPNSKDDDDFVEVNATEAPAWVQGTWVYNDDGDDGLGKVTVIISGNHLKEQINDQEAAEGTFYYSNGILHFESPDGSSRCDYRLNHKRKSIEWQDGKLMEKVN
jgi:hypothetical protein